jgi:hypothetical protein
MRYNNQIIERFPEVNHFLALFLTPGVSRDSSGVLAL